MVHALLLAAALGADPAQQLAPDNRGPFADDLPLSGPKLDQIVGTVLVCYAQESKMRALAEIGDEREAAKYAGVVDKAKLYRLQKQAHAADKTGANGRATLKTAGRKQLHCDTPVVRHLTDCLNAGGETNSCEGEAWRRFRAALRVKD